MRIGFIGAGKVGFSLGRYLAEHGVELAGYASRSPESAREAAVFAGGQAFASPEELVAASDLVFLTVPDGQIAAVWEQLASAARAGALDLEAKVICHCSGALTSAEFAGAAELGAFAYSVHPLLAINSKRDSYREIGRAPITIEGDPACLDAIVRIFRSCGNDVHVIAPEHKVRYHAAAVMASNLVVGLIHMAAGELELCGLSPEEAERALRPISAGNALHIASDGITAALTGPAARGDLETIERHLACLEGDDREVYRIITDHLLGLVAAREA
ncbi:MAG: Rossmann-like and DUF2520 domain-containing protein [Coriobacteriales bacterium]|jgi:predicted short-subunit dehydrogenase-like oxidoreductase (DUF2520 family)